MKALKLHFSDGLAGFFFLFSFFFFFRLKMILPHTKEVLYKHSQSRRLYSWRCWRCTFLIAFLLLLLFSVGNVNSARCSQSTSSYSWRRWNCTFPNSWLLLLFLSDGNVLPHAHNQQAGFMVYWCMLCMTEVVMQRAKHTHTHRWHPQRYLHQ